MVREEKSDKCWNVEILNPVSIVHSFCWFDSWGKRLNESLPESSHEPF